MPRGDKSSYTDKQKRQAEDIEHSEKARGRSSKTAERIAWATVNKQDGGGKKKSAAKKKPATKKIAKKTTAKKSSTKKASGKRAPRSRA